MLNICCLILYLNCRHSEILPTPSSRAVPLDRGRGEEEMAAEVYPRSVGGDIESNPDAPIAVATGHFVSPMTTIAQLPQAQHSAVETF
jgi:hypothetical protein